LHGRAGRSTAPKRRFSARAVYTFDVVKMSILLQKLAAEKKYEL
jgi:hypothetical protein